jgi:hypothetical protein
MDKQRRFSIPFILLSFCICLGVLSILFVTNVVGISVLEVYEIDFDQTEFEEDSFVLESAAISIAGLVFEKFRRLNLGFQPVSLSPVSPPPKHT